MTWLSAFNQEETVSITHMVNTRVPIRRYGYAAVVGVMALQVALLVVSSYRFLRSCRNSILNDAWFVVSQVSASPETAHILARSSTITDAQARAYARPDTQHNVLYDDAGSNEDAAPSQNLGVWSARTFVVRDGAFRPLIGRFNEIRTLRQRLGLGTR
jgi:hypothetical protein